MAELWVNPRVRGNEGEKDKRQEKYNERERLRKTVREVGSKGYIDRYEEYRSGFGHC